ncbi:MAG: glycerol-3-phosphate dehydrogenase [Granulosicoccus sp.]
MYSSTSPNGCDFDLVVIGGGINGAGIARDAVGRGLRVMICEKDDLAGHTSSASTKLIHGGLRYLEHYDFSLVRHALQEREVLLKAAPHIIWPLRFILPHHQGLRPRWLIRLGLFLYDHIGGRKQLPTSNSVDLRAHVSGNALRDEFASGFEYSDCWVQDARLVTLNAMDAAERGCDVRVRTECIGISRGDGQWTVDLHSKLGDTRSSVTARAIVNASGPWVEKTLDLDKEHDASHSIRLVKGSHIVVPKIFEHTYAYIFQNGDNRVLFAVPYENNYTLLGTTDVEVDSEPGKGFIEQKEIDYICRAVSDYFKIPVSAADVVWSYSGVRPLYDDATENASKVTRDYKLDLDVRKNAPVLSVYGGKITTYRKLAEQAVDMLNDLLSIQKGSWTADATLPGGDLPGGDYDAFIRQLSAQLPWLEQSLLLDYARNYGTRIAAIVGDAESMDALGVHFGGLLYQAEVDYLITCEWARSADDVLWRRSKKGLHVPESAVEKLQSYIDKHYTFTGVVPVARCSNEMA